MKACLAWPLLHGLCCPATFREAPHPRTLHDARGPLTAPRSLLLPLEARHWTILETPSAKPLLLKTPLIPQLLCKTLLPWDYSMKLAATWVTSLLSSQPPYEAACHHFSTVLTPTLALAPAHGELLRGLGEREDQDVLHALHGDWSPVWSWQHLALHIY